MNEIRHFHFFCGSGGGASGFNQGHARIGERRIPFRCLGGIDSDAAAVRDFEQLAGAPGTLRDLFSRDQYVGFHGQEPPADWREAMPEELHRAAGHEHPHIVFTSPPCKGFSGLLPPARAAAPKYAALNGLALRDEETGALVLDGSATGAWRERIGNAVPPPAAAAIASVMGQALALAHAGESFVLSAMPIWVRSIAIAASVALHDSRDTLRKSLTSREGHHSG